MYRAKDIYRELSPVYLASKFTGLAPYRYDGKLSLLNSSMNIFLMLTTVAVTAVHTVAPISGRSIFSLILGRGQVLLRGTITVVSLGTSFVNGQPLAELVGHLCEVDDVLNGSGALVRPSRRFSAVKLLTQFTSLAPVILLDLHNCECLSLRVLATECIMFVSQSVAFVVEMQFAALAHCAKHRLTTMISALSTFRNIRLGREPQKTAYYRLHGLLNLSKCHRALINTMTSTNSLFSLQLLLLVFSIFLLSTISLYHLIDTITRLRSDDYSQILASFLKLCMRSYEIWTVTTVCVETQDKVKEFNRKLYQVIIEDETGTLIENKELRMHLLMKNEVEFTAFNFFPLDYTLVHSMISAATTYLVILVQFSSLSAPNEPK